MSGHDDQKLTLDRLIHVSLSRKFPPTTFGKLFREFRFKRLAESSDDSQIDMLPLYDNCKSSLLQLGYIFEVVVNDDLNNTFDDLTELFSVYIPKMSGEDRTAIMIYFNQNSDKFSWNSMAQSKKFVEAFESFLSKLSKGNGTQKEDAKMALMVTKFVVNLLNSDYKMPESFKKQVEKFSDYLKSSGFNSSSQYLNRSLNHYSLSVVKKDYQSLNFLNPGPQNSLETSKLLNLKKILWISQQVTVKFTPMNDRFIRIFKGLLNISRVTTSATNTSIAYELSVSLFTCLSLSTRKTEHLWTNTILNKLPQAFKLLKISEAKLTSTLKNVFHNVGYAKNKVTIDRLLRNLCLLQLVKPESFEDIAGNDSSTIKPDPSTEIGSDDLKRNYASIFHTSNPEFVSIEEAGAFKFMDQVSQSIQMMATVSKLVLASIDSFVSNGDSLRLRRLLISLAYNKSVLDFVVLNLSPYDLINKLLSFLDEQVEKKPETEVKSSQFLADNNNDFMDLDLDGDDSSNAQDFFTDFGTVLIFVQYTVFRYNMNLWKFENKEKTLQLLNNASTVNANFYLEKLQDPSSPLNAIINEWIGSFFDNVNTDGISDDLIKKCSLQDYHFIMPRIVEEAVSAYSMSIIDEDTLMGGLEYFYQPFLINNLTTIFRYLVNVSWSKENQGDIITLTKILTKLSVSDEMSPGVKVLHSMVMEIVNDDVYFALQNLNSLSEVENYLEKLHKPNEDSANLKNLIRFVSEGTPVKFELCSVYQIVDSTGLKLDWFYDQLVCLLYSSSQRDESVTHTSREFLRRLDYEVVASLMVYYSSFKTCTTLKSWVTRLNSFNEEKKYGVTYNREASPELEIYDSNEEKRKEEEVKNDDLNTLSVDDNLLGFIKDPDEDIKPEIKSDDAMDVDVKKDGTTEDDEKPNGDKGHSSKVNDDLYNANLLVLIQKNDPKVMNDLVTCILTNLTLIY